MKRPRQAKDGELKRRKMVHSSYLGQLKDGKRDGIHKIIITGNCESIATICPFVNGLKEGDSHSFLQKNGRLLNYTRFKQDRIVEQLDLSTIPITRGIIDYEDGSRWEGEICGDRSSGKGQFYSPENQLVYDGMSVNNKREGYGISYYPFLDTQRKLIPHYEGEWKCNQYSGFGKLFDRTGKVVSNCEWLDGKLVKYCSVVQQSDSTVLLHTLLEELKITSNSLNTIESFDIHSLEKLKRLLIEDQCLQKVNTFEIQNHRSLEYLSIGNDCFSSIQQDWKSQRQSEQDAKKMQKTLHITNNPHLQVMVIRQNSFTDYVSFSVRGKNSSYR